MTDWLNVEDVRISIEAHVADREFLMALARVQQKSGIALKVLEALAELDPRQLQAYGCDENCNRNNPISNAAGKPCDCAPGHFFRLWSIARLICGKEES